MLKHVIVALKLHRIQFQPCLICQDDDRLNALNLVRFYRSFSVVKEAYDV
jgi:hypothetical protein